MSSDAVPERNARIVAYFLIFLLYCIEKFYTFALYLYTFGIERNIF